MQITSLEQLKKIKNDIVQLPNFDDGTQFIAEVKRPNMLMLVSIGAIPNSLLKMVMDVFQNGKGQDVANKALKNPKDFQDLITLMTVIAKHSLVNPSYAQLEEIGIGLNENQFSALYTYAQGGVKSLENFCKEQTGTKSN